MRKSRGPARASSSHGSMSLNEATARWLYMLGMRNSFVGVETQPALPTGESYERDMHIAAIRRQDVMTMVMGMMRMFAQLYIECCQLLNRHPSLRPDDTVEVDADDDLLMQTSMVRHDPPALTDDEIQQMASDEVEEKRWREARLQQEEEEEQWREECLQKEDEEARRQLEEYERLQGPPKRLCIRVGTQGDDAMVNTCIRREVNLHITVGVESTETTASHPDAGSAQPGGVGKWGPTTTTVEEVTERAYQQWKKGHLTDENVEGIFDQQILTVFHAQLLMDYEEVTRAS